MPRNTTLHDVAAAVGVSARTVSRAVNGEPGLSDATRKRVLETVERMNYQTNMLARGLRANRSNTIGLIVTDLTDPFFPALAQSVQQTASKSGHTLILASTQKAAETESQILASFRARGVDGTIMFAADGQRRDVLQHAREGLPMVLIDDQDGPAENLTSIRNDLEGGARAAVRHLLEEGHRAIAMISNVQSPERSRGRDRGYAEEMRLAGLGDRTRIVYEEATVDGGAAGMAALLSSPPRPTGVFAYNDLMAIGAMRAAQAAGLVVPDDLAIVGFDDIRMASLVSPMLSTVRIDRERLGQTAVARLLELIERRAGSGAEEPPSATVPVLGCDLIVRESSRRAHSVPTASHDETRQEPDVEATHE
ncbi:LacI family DNA-binding transcriptional regulator [Euzebya tangerina]|uniref:LacI family DNA-binding transcriptional regulator n=1 Tax=Euzebya tangerina TaxID=591198 RepID=UPI000E31F1B6|nr:LacI family DNA-binding transcriptional regulator [Euzebya tangerina]